MDVTPSQIAYAAVLLALINVGKGGNDGIQIDNPLTAVYVLCFLSNRVDYQTCHEFENLFSLFADLETFITDASIECEDYSRLQKFIFAYLKGLYMVDDLIEFIDNFRGVFDTNLSLSSNDLIAPNRICNDSLLGLFIRSLLVKWDCLPFDQICALHDSLTVFLIDNKPIVYSSGFNEFNGPSILSKDKQLLSLASLASADGDIYFAEKLIHEVFDMNGGGITELTPSKLIIFSSTNSLDAIQGLNEPRISGSRHQEALLKLATIWMQNGYYPLAMTAVEEAMKVAHQRGDHTSVARALLLLHHIVAGLESTNGNYDKVCSSIYRHYQVLSRFCFYFRTIDN